MHACTSCMHAGSGEATGAPRQAAAPSGRLRSVHEAAAPSPVPEGTRATVRGVYEYYHYAQGGVDDRGWGCAYRSLQTIWSWAWHQRLTDAQPPTHRCARPRLSPTRACTHAAAMHWWSRGDHEVAMWVSPTSWDHVGSLGVGVFAGNRRNPHRRPWQTHPHLGSTHGPGQRGCQCLYGFGCDACMHTL